MPTLTATFYQQGNSNLNSTTANVMTCLRYGYSTVSTINDLGGIGSGTAYQNGVVIKFNGLPNIPIASATLNVAYDDTKSDFPNTYMTIQFKATAKLTSSTTGVGADTGTGTDSYWVSAASWSKDITTTINACIASGTKTISLWGNKADNRRRIKSVTLTYTPVTPTLVRSTVGGYGSVTDRYAIYAEVENAINVKIPTWTLANGQDDARWVELSHWSKYQTAPWTIDGQTYSYAVEVFRSSHNNEFGTYISQLYANHGYGEKYLGRSYYAFYTQTMHFKDSLDPTGADIATSKTLNWGATLGTLPTPTKTGYTFTGWSTTQDGSKPVTASSQLYKANGFELMNTQEAQPPCNLYAQWMPNECTINFDAQGGTVSPTSMTVSNGDTVPIPTSTRTGYTFIDWNLYRSDGKWYIGNSQWATEFEIEANGYTKRAYSPGSTIPFNSSWLTGYLGTPTFTFYANWTPHSYTITFNAQGGTVSPTSKTITYGSTYGELPLPTRDKYAFLGWSISETEYIPVLSSDIFNSETDITLYAFWELSNIQINFYNTDLGKTVIRRYAPNSNMKLGYIKEMRKCGYDLVGYTTLHSDTVYGLDTIVDIIVNELGTTQFNLYPVVEYRSLLYLAITENYVRPV